MAFVCALVTALPSTAQQPDGAGILDLTLAPAEITVGDRIEARLTLVWTGTELAAEPEFPAWRESWGDAEVLSFGGVETVIGPDPRRIYHQDLVLTAFVTGEVRLPEVAVTLIVGDETVEIGSGENGFTVRSVLPEDGGELEPRPSAPPRPLAGDARFSWTVGALGALGLLLGWLLARRVRELRDGSRPAPAEPLAELLDRLRHLDPAAAEPAHTGLSRGLRDFLGRSLGFPAAESTTTEIERRLDRAPEPEAATLAPLRGAVVHLLRDCDQVKFARSPVPAPVTRDRLSQARDLGQRIDRGLQDPDPESAP